MFFVLFFSIWLILFSILGNTFLGIYFLCYFLFFLFYLYKQNKFSGLTEKTPQIVNYLWLLFISVSFISLFFSINFPITLDKLMIFIFSYFIFYLSTHVFSKKKYKNYFLLSFLITSYFILFLYLLILLNGQLINLLPVFSVFYSKLGHSHVSAFFLLSIASSLYLYFEYKNKFFFFSSFIFLIAIFFAYARINFFLGLLEIFLVLFFLLKQNKKYIKEISIIKKSLMIAVFLMGLFSSILYFSCFKNDSLTICRGASFSSRIHYWKQALSVIKEKPILGSGLGTYIFSSKKWLIERSTFSTYAHNFFLQMYSDLGLIGGSIFVLLFFYLLFYLYKVSIQSNNPQKFVIFSGILVSYLNALFDFDWNLNIIFVSTLIFISFLLDKKINNFSRNIIMKFIEKLSLLIMIVYFLGYLFIDGLISFKKEYLAFDFYPYFFWHSKVFLNLDIPLEKKDNFLKVNRANFSIQEELLKSKNINTKYTDLALTNLQTFYPWKRYGVNKLLTYLSGKHYQKFVEEAKVVVNIIYENKTMFGEELPYQDVDRILQLLADGSRETYLAGLYNESAELLKLSTLLDKYALNSFEPPFSSSESVVLNKDFVEVIADFDTEAFGDNAYSYVKYMNDYLAEIDQDSNLSEEEKNYFKLKIKDKIIKLSLHYGFFFPQ